MSSVFSSSPVYCYEFILPCLCRPIPLHSTMKIHSAHTHANFTVKVKPLYRNIDIINSRKRMNTKNFLLTERPNEVNMSKRATSIAVVFYYFTLQSAIVVNSGKSTMNFLNGTSKKDEKNDFQAHRNQFCRGRGHRQREKYEETRE